MTNEPDKAAASVAAVSPLQAIVAEMRERAKRLRNGSAEVQPVADFIEARADRLAAVAAAQAGEQQPVAWGVLRVDTGTLFGRSSTTEEEARQLATFASMPVKVIRLYASPVAQVNEWPYVVERIQIAIEHGDKHGWATARSELEALALSRYDVAQGWQAIREALEQADFFLSHSGNQRSIVSGNFAKPSGRWEQLKKTRAVVKQALALLPEPPTKTGDKT